LTGNSIIKEQLPEGKAMSEVYRAIRFQDYNWVEFKNLGPFHHHTITNKNIKTKP